jgi:hypothetical protein
MRVAQGRGFIFDRAAHFLGGLAIRRHGLTAMYYVGGGLTD